ncbi:MAG: hypothetical protein KAS78_06505, partial [Candidatus Pacebacteria bacterium]|nr:hypothetical protein [Candidatus Paceibacterota bacterium]
MQEKIKIGNLDAILHNPKASGSPGIVMVHGFGGEGLEEEFEDIANSYHEIAKVEEKHEKRFRKLL